MESLQAVVSSIDQLYHKVKDKMKGGFRTKPAVIERPQMKGSLALTRSPSSAL